jgi:hypothetical protein
MCIGAARYPDEDFEGQGGAGLRCNAELALLWSNLARLCKR